MFRHAEIIAGSYYAPQLRLFSTPTYFPKWRRKTQLGNQIKPHNMKNADRNERVSVFPFGHSNKRGRADKRIKLEKIEMVSLQRIKQLRHEIRGPAASRLF